MTGSVGRVLDDGRVALLLSPSVARQIGDGVVVAATSMNDDGAGPSVEVVRLARWLARRGGASGHVPDIGGAVVGVSRAAAVEAALGLGASEVMRTTEAAVLIGRCERQARRLLPSAGRGLVRVDDVAELLARRSGGA